MNLQEFRATLANDTPPQGISTALQAMWHQGKGDWNAAHSLTNRIKASLEVGFMLTCIVLKVIKSMLPIGIAWQGNHSAR